MTESVAKTLVTVCENAGVRVKLTYEERMVFGDADPVADRLGHPRCTGQRLCGLANRSRTGVDWAFCPHLPGHD